MSTRIAKTFARLHEQGEKALVAFVTAGDPQTIPPADLVVALVEAGADIVELGVPFSDPLADGPTIQASSFRALQGGMTPPKVLEVVRQVRTRSQVPLVLMGAWNPALQYGVERFAQAAVEAGADATIMTDLSPEEAGEWKRASDEANLDTVFLLAPTSTPARMALVGRMASGFIYCVSRTGVTGARDHMSAELPELLTAIRERAGKTPICVGFGISTPDHVRAVCRVADGAVVGSALVDLLHRERENPNVLNIVKDYVATLKAATRP